MAVRLTEWGELVIPGDILTEYGAFVMGPLTEVGDFVFEPAAGPIPPTPMPTARVSWPKGRVPKILSVEG